MAELLGAVCLAQRELHSQCPDRTAGSTSSGLCSGVCLCRILDSPAVEREPWHLCFRSVMPSGPGDHQDVCPGPQVWVHSTVWSDEAGKTMGSALLLYSSSRKKCLTLCLSVSFHNLVLQLSLPRGSHGHSALLLPK